MPIIQIHILEGRSTELKRELISEVTDAVSRTLRSPRESIRVLLNEIPEENWGVAGVPIFELRNKNN
ncbi:4-oxalocrotonate tautomerase [Bacillus sp. RG28]|uniref:Tautomerase n=1 Tax=Gottfriedia endophytica TaxID=2820819 RepID=A0A940SL87_9BACI|nr:4-oxalocrotonate tautomerase [Gottfriedia endophytica]MBP0727216.1 4-oxalocrotonate tautomerase [Gottfriedia endophytica]